MVITGKHLIQGIGAGFIPAVLDLKVFDEVFKVHLELICPKKFFWSVLCFAILFWIWSKQKLYDHVSIQYDSKVSLRDEVFAPFKISCNVSMYNMTQKLA